MRKIKWWIKRTWIGFVIWFLHKSADDTFELNWKKLGPYLWQKCAPALPYAGAAIGSATIVTGTYFVLRFLYEKVLHHVWALFCILLLLLQARYLLAGNPTQKQREQAFAIMMLIGIYFIAIMLIKHLSELQEEKKKQVAI